MAEKQVVTRPGGTPKFQRDAALNNSDKSFTVPTGKVWELRYIFIGIKCTATVGNRALRVIFTNGTNTIWNSVTGGSITASQNGNLHCVLSLPTGSSATRIGPDDAVPNVGTIDCLPPFLLPAGYVVRCLDSNAVDAAADDLTVVIHYIEYEA